jgi:hypothetical protein
MSINDVADDALEKFNELFDDLGDTIMGATELPQANEKGPYSYNEEDPYSYNPLFRPHSTSSDGG